MYRNNRKSVGLKVFISLTLYLMLGSLTVYAQFSGGSNENKKLPESQTWEWRIDNWDSKKHHHLVLEYTFYENHKFIKYQRVETADKPYNEIFNTGDWKRDGEMIEFFMYTDDRKIQVRFQPGSTTALFRFKVYDKKTGTLIRKYINEFTRLPVSSDYPQRLTDFN